MTRRRLSVWALVLFSLAACRTDARRAPVDATVAAPPLEFLVTYTGGAKPADTLPMIIAVHGLGDRPERFRGFVERFDRPVRVIIPRAPTAHGDGLGWFRVGRFPVDPSEPRLNAGSHRNAIRMAFPDFLRLSGGSDLCAGQVAKRSARMCRERRLTACARRS